MPGLPLGGLLPENRRMAAVRTKKKKRAGRRPEDGLPTVSDWRTTDEQEVLKRQVRAREERPRVTNLTPEHRVFSAFRVDSTSGMSYRVEIRDLAARTFHCTCTDFRINGLGTCKHVEAVLSRVTKRRGRKNTAGAETASNRIDIVPDPEREGLRVERNLGRLSPALRELFDAEGNPAPDMTPEEVHERLLRSRSKNLRISEEVALWLEDRARKADQVRGRREYETGVAKRTHPERVTLSPLYPYQREGMLHLAFRERALLADEMGLGKTIQAIAAAALLHHLGKAKRALVVCPASLKTEWEEQITRFTTLSQRLIYGGRNARLDLYAEETPPFFTILNYEQVVRDSLDLNRLLRPDLVILDEAQRIKNWATKTAQAVKRLQSRYAFVLTGTPIENRIDELHSIMDFLNPSILGPLYLFNRQYYQLDERGRPSGYKNLNTLRERIRPWMLRRRKADVETELPDRTDRNHLVTMTKAMWEEYNEYKRYVGDLVKKAKRRPLTRKEQDMLMVFLNMMRMICDSPGIIKNNTNQDCPKLKELASVLDEALSEGDVKVIIFSEWEGMLRKVREFLEKEGYGYAWHTGSVPQKKRRGEIRRFQTDPDCRVFLSTDSGGVGLNLQNASMVINCDLPWNPAKLEQRIARAWRKNQLRAVTVINLVAEGTIEHGMLATLEQKKGLADGVLDGVGELGEIKLKSGRQAFFKRLEQVMLHTPDGTSEAKGAVVAESETERDPSLAFARSLEQAFGEHLFRCEEARIPGRDEPVLFVVTGEKNERAARLAEKVLAETTNADAPIPRVECLDRKTWETLERLRDMGMISFEGERRRTLLDRGGDRSPPALTPEQRERIDKLRALAKKKHRFADALREDGLAEDADRFLAEARKAEEEAAGIESGRVG